MGWVKRLTKNIKRVVKDTDAYGTSKGAYQ